MSSARCQSCHKPALAGKSHCLDHHKEQSGYAYGMDHDLKLKMDAKNDPAKAEAVRVWIQSVTGKQVAHDLHAALKSGVILCDLINVLWPGSVTRINQGAMPFVQRENVVQYLDASKRHGLRETDCFVTQDLFEGTNMAQVVDQICALGHLASTKGYRGPQLVISGGAVQVASSVGRVAAPVAPQVPLTQAAYVAPSSNQSTHQTYKTAPSASSAPAPAARSFGAPAPAPAAASSGAAFCGGCGSKRVGGAAFCGSCGGKF